MYLGPPDARGLHDMLLGLAAQAFGPFPGAGVAAVRVELRPDGSVEITDARRNDDEVFGNISERFTQFDTHWTPPPERNWTAYTVANALSEWMTVEARAVGCVQRHSFRRGEIAAPPESAPSADPPGLKVVFKPDALIFGHTRFDPDRVRARLRELACLHSGTRVTFSDGTVEKVFHFPDGVRVLIEYLAEGRRPLHTDVIVVRGERDGVRYEAGVRWCEDDEQTVVGYANGNPTPYGGTHVNGIRAAVLRGLNAFIASHLASAREVRRDEVRAGLTCAVSVWLTDPQFMGSLKQELGNPIVEDWLPVSAGRALEDYLTAQPQTGERVARAAAARHTGPPLTDDEWRACDNPRRLLQVVGDRGTRRRTVLFVAACYRQTWGVRPSKAQRSLLAGMEAYAAGTLTRSQFLALPAPSGRAANLQRRVGTAAFGPTDAGREAEHLRAGTPAAAARQAAFARDIFGNPNRHTAIEPAWRTSTVLALAKAIDATGSFADMPILADSLQDAGCEEAHVLDHCRGAHAHTRGCWVIDAILGRA